MSSIENITNLLRIKGWKGTWLAWIGVSWVTKSTIQFYDVTIWFDFHFEHSFSALRAMPRSKDRWFYGLTTVIYIFRSFFKRWHIFFFFYKKQLDFYLVAFFAGIRGRKVQIIVTKITDSRVQQKILSFGDSTITKKREKFSLLGGSIPSKIFIISPVQFSSFPTSKPTSQTNQ